MTDADAIKNFHADDNNNASFKFKEKTGVAAAGGTKNVEVMVPLKYLSSIWRTLEMSLINAEIKLILT